MKARSPALAPRPLAMLVVAAFVLAAALATLTGCGGRGSGSPAVTSPGSSSSSAMPVARQLVIAAASGPHANGISVISSTGQVMQLVAAHGGPIRDLAWSPDGSRLAYAQVKSVSDGTSSVWVYDVATGKTRPLIDSYVQEGWGGAWYAWVGPTELVAAANLTRPRRFFIANGTLFAVDVTNGTRTIVRDDGGRPVVGDRPTASADGAHIAFVRYGGTATQEYSVRTFREQLLILDVDAGAVRQVARSEATMGPDSDGFSFPQISPDGSLIYTCQTSGDPGFACTVYRTDGSKVYVNPRLTCPTPGSWLTGKGTLAFGGGALTTPISDAINVWLPGTPKATAIVAHPSGTGLVSSLTWTPHGKQIVYTVGDWGYPNGDLWIVNADGTNKHRLLHNGCYPACAEAPISFP
jgi:Tol biopolymer transport system component